jgi:hypothetical protein
MGDVVPIDPIAALWESIEQAQVEWCAERFKDADWSFRSCSTAEDWVGSKVFVGGDYVGFLTTNAKLESVFEPEPFIQETTFRPNPYKDLA